MVQSCQFEREYALNPCQVENTKQNIVELKEGIRIWKPRRAESKNTRVCFHGQRQNSTAQSGHNI